MPGTVRRVVWSVTRVLFDELLQIAPLTAAQPPVEVQRSVDALVSVLLADGLNARRTGPDRLEVSWSAEGPIRGSMEWCWLGELVIGRVLDDADPTSWTHRHVPGKGNALADTGRTIGRTVRRVGGLPTF